MHVLGGLALRSFTVCSLVASVSLLTVGCSTFSSEEPSQPTYLAQAPKKTSYRPANRPQPVSTQYRNRPSRGTNCLNEPEAKRPFPRTITVRRGENLCRLAKRYQTTVQAIVDENALSSPILPVGKRLRLPSPRYYSSSPYGRLRRR